MKKYITSIIVCAFFSLLAGIALGMSIMHKIIDKKQSTIATDTLVVVDTLRCDVPVVSDSTVVKYVTRWLKPVQSNTDTNTVMIQPVTDSTNVNEVAVVDVNSPADEYVEVEIPIVQKKYETDNYTAWVSGYEPQLDSINVYNQTQIITNTVYKTEKKGKWGCVVGIGAGVDNKASVKPFIGVTLGYRIF